MKELLPAAALALAIAATPALAEPLAYVTNQKSGTVSVIDTRTDAVIAELPAGQGPRGAALGARNEKLFVSDEVGKSLVVLDLKERKPIDAIPLGLVTEGVSMKAPWVIAASELGNSVIFIDPDTHSEIFRVPTRGDNPEHAVFSPDGNQVYASAEEGSVVDVIDVERRESVKTIRVGRRPRGIGFLPDGSRAYVANELSDTVSVIDTKKQKVIKTIEVGVRANGIAVSPQGDRVYVSNGGDHTVSVIDTASHKVIATIPVGKRPWNMALTPDGKKLYVACGRSDAVSVIDTERKRQVASIAVGKLPWGVVIPPQKSFTACSDCDD